MLRQTLVLSTFIHKVWRHWSLKSQSFSLLYKSSFSCFVLTTAAVVSLSVFPRTHKRKSRNGITLHTVKTHTAGPQWQMKVEEIWVSDAVINLSDSSLFFSFCKRTLARRTLVLDVNSHTALTSRLWSALSSCIASPRAYFSDKNSSRGAFKWGTNASLQTTSKNTLDICCYIPVQIGWYIIASSSAQQKHFSRLCN